MLESLKNHKIDEEQTIQFTWMTIQMSFAHNIVLKEITNAKAQNATKKQMFQLIELINGIIAGTISIQKLKIDYKNKDEKTIPLTSNFSEQITLNLISSSLMFYQIAYAEIIKKEYELLSTSSFDGIIHSKKVNDFYTFCGMTILIIFSKINWFRIKASHSREKLKIISDRQIFLSYR